MKENLKLILDIGSGVPGIDGCQAVPNQLDEHLMTFLSCLKSVLCRVYRAQTLGRLSVSITHTRHLLGSK